MRRKINKIIVHCSASPEGRADTIDDIRSWHRAEGKIDVGYHYVIERDGSIKEGRDIDMIGAHCKGQNANSIGVCYIGGLTEDCQEAKDTRTEAQKRSLIKLLKELKAKYPDASIYGHRDFAAKACPSFDAKNEYKDI